MNLFRIIKHVMIPDWLARRPFSAAVCARIEQSIKASETMHRGEIRLAVESGFDLLPLLKGITPRDRALKVFSDLGVWDTEENTGVLVYLQLVDRELEIVADRGIHACVDQQAWESICRRMEAAFREGRFEEGAISGLREITDLLARHFPARAENSDELPNRPVML